MGQLCNLLTLCSGRRSVGRKGLELAALLFQYSSFFVLSPSEQCG